jgi:hypothetical protein
VFATLVLRAFQIIFLGHLEFLPHRSCRIADLFDKLAKLFPADP